MSTMNEHVIDRNTGLPPLPSGHWWEVRKYESTKYGSWGSSVVREDGYQVCVVKEAVIPASSRPGKHWWSADVVIPGRTLRKVVCSKQIVDQDLLAKQTTISNITAGGEGLSVSDIGKEHIEPADILKAALEIMDDIEEAKAERERRAASDSLLGAYPPKALTA